MYRLVKFKKSQGMEEADFEFKTLDDFRDAASLLLAPLVGNYRVNIATEDVIGIQEFVREANLYNHLTVRIYTTQAVIDYITMRDSSVVVDRDIKEYDLFKQLASQRNLLLERGLLFTLYGSVEHSTEEMNKLLDLLLNEFGANRMITEKMAAQFIILNKTVYPRRVMMEYLFLSRWRKSKLDKCVKVIGNDITVRAIIKNLKQLVTEKSQYLKTGKGSAQIRAINTERLLVMYRVFGLERCRINDVYVLLKLYEKGVSVRDIINRETD